MGEARAHWFMEGHDGAALEPCIALPQDTTCEKNIVLHLWRSSHLPPPSLRSTLEEHKVTSATVVGVKAGYAVQSTVQTLCDTSPHVDVSVIRECIADEVPARLQAIMTHVLPIYAEVVSLEEYVEYCMGHLEGYATYLSTQPPSALPFQNQPLSVQHVCDVGRGGHMSLFTSRLLHRSSSSNWCTYPTQPWYDNYQCPLGKRVVDFCDEPQFSRMTMFLKGREWLDEKDKLCQLVQQAKNHHKNNNKEEQQEQQEQNVCCRIPDTFVVSSACTIQGSSEQKAFFDWANNLANTSFSGPWFVKECQKNAGRAIHVCRTPSDCLSVISKLKLQQGTGDVGTFVVQPHVSNPLLTSEGYKCHVKLYGLLQCRQQILTTAKKEDEPTTTTKNKGEEEKNEGRCTYTWSLHTHNVGYLCTSSQPWKASDVSHETQLTLLRSMRLELLPDEDKNNNNKNKSTPDNIKPRKNDNNDNTKTDTETDACWQEGNYASFWSQFYPACQASLTSLIHAAISQHLLKIRPSPTEVQFELFSVDFLFDKTHPWHPWLLECNFSPVLFHPKYHTVVNSDNEEEVLLTTQGLQTYRQRYDEAQDKTSPNVVNDADMVEEALSLVFLPDDDAIDKKKKKKKGGGWELVKTWEVEQEVSVSKKKNKAGGDAVGVDKEKKKEEEVGVENGDGSTGGAATIVEGNGAAVVSA